MRQYQQFKARHPGYILFFRMGDFYEMFWEDAQTAANVLGLALTSRSKGDEAIPMAGVPFHSVDGYLRKMIAAGFKVAICEQTEDASQAKGLIKRDVVRLMTPGTLTDDPLLDGRSENFLAAVAVDSGKIGLAWAELSTGACWGMSGSEKQILDEIGRLHPAEVLIPELSSGQPHDIEAALRQRGVSAFTSRPGWQFSAHHAREQILKQWGAATTAGFGFEDGDPAVGALAAVVSYLEETQRTNLTHLRQPRRHRIDEHMSIDPSSWRSLEIDRTVRSGGIEGSLLSAIDRTATSMGGRLLRQWLRTPLFDVEAIVTRQAAIGALLESPSDLRDLSQRLREICDIERIIARVAVGRAAPRDLASLGRCLASLPELIDRLQSLPQAEAIAPEIYSLRSFAVNQAGYLTSAIGPDPAPHLREGGVIAANFDPELDRLRQIGASSRQWLAEYQARLARETGIHSLKVSYNKVFGYYIEVTDSHREKVPTAWCRRQTVRNAERYVTEELKQFEDEATTASDRAIALEQRLFEQIRQQLLPYIATFQELAYALARLDCLSSLALLAQERRYCRPSITAERVLEIVGGRHPVLEQQLGPDFVANDVVFSAEDSLMLITGPNMAGKSTYIRQTALIVLMSQIGSYVPAQSAAVGLCDRLFTRIGASDEIHGGQSTFMVEMTETANILNNATDRSLVVLDEIGRGTSTLDGLSLAWAIAEHIASEVRCRTLFATHYHELTDLASRFKGVRNLNVAVREWEDQVIFLHRIVEGGTDRSYGIHVARLAGIPADVLKRARQLLSELAVQHVGKPKISAKQRRTEDDQQLKLFVDPRQEVITILAGANLDELTPMQAFDLLRKLKEKLR